MATIESFNDEVMKAQARRAVLEHALVQTGRRLRATNPKPLAASRAYREARDAFQALEGAAPSLEGAAEILALLEAADAAIGTAGASAGQKIVPDDLEPPTEEGLRATRFWHFWRRTGKGGR